MSFTVKGCKKIGQSSACDIVVSGSVNGGASDTVFEFNNCVAFGPEMEGYGEVIIHQPNERIQIRAIEDIMKIYYKAYADLIEKVSFK
jgi:acetylornithine deacetylase/succinyl-diaminopimelate desuccinylase-like protein